MVLFTGSTVEEAIQTGLKELGIPRMKAHIKVVSREKKGFFGHTVLHHILQLYCPGITLPLLHSKRCPFALQKGIF